jgi:hypothetical protein
MTQQTDASDEEPIKDRRELSRGERIRDYRADGRLYAYLAANGEEHVVISQGREPRDKWTKRVPAERQRVVPGQKLWTIPQNWEERVYSTRDNIAYALYYIPDTEMWVEASVPTNDYLVDAWYGVRAVGTIDGELVGDFGSRSEVAALAEDVEDAGDSSLAEAVRIAKRDWAKIKQSFHEDLDFLVRDRQPWEVSGSDPMRLRNDWIFEAQEHLYRPDLFMENSAKIELPDDISEREVVAALDDEGLLPNRYCLELGIDESGIGMEYYTRALIEAGASTTAAIDYYMVNVEGSTQTEWADERGVQQSAVSQNISEAESTIGKY